MVSIVWTVGLVIQSKTSNDICFEWDWVWVALLGYGKTLGR